MNEIVAHSQKWGDRTVLVDDDDYQILSNHHWSVTGGKSNNLYASRKITLPGGKRKILFMHRVIMDMINSTNQVDHINRNTFDNRKTNLRVATRKQNRWNSTASLSSTSSFKGVSWSSQFSNWHAQIGIDREVHHLGFFDDEIQAARAFDEFSFALHGDFAYLNFPDELHIQPECLNVDTFPDMITNRMAVHHFTKRKRMCEHLGICTGTLDHWMRGGRPTLANLRRICKVLELNFMEACRLLGYGPNAIPYISARSAKRDS